MPSVPIHPEMIVRRAAHLKAAGYSWDTIAARLHVPADVLELFPADAPEWAAHYDNGCRVANDEFVADARNYAIQKFAASNRAMAIATALGQAPGVQEIVGAGLVGLALVVMTRTGKGAAQALLRECGAAS